MSKAKGYCYYFGVLNEIGHYLYVGNRSISGRYLPDDFPVAVSALDGRLLPPNLPQKEGRAELIHLKDHTILTFWDRSFDKRHGSSSTFIMQGIFDFSKAIEIAKEHYPNLWLRFEFEVIQR